MIYKRVKAIEEKDRKWSYNKREGGSFVFFFFVEKRKEKKKKKEILLVIVSLGEKEKKGEDVLL